MAEQRSRKKASRMARIESLLISLAGLNYSYALRVVVGVAIAWWIAYKLQTDKPYWSLMTVMIVTLPTQGGLVEKFIARLVGTVIGAIMVNLIAGIALNDYWHFVIYMAIWLSICAYLASMAKNIMTYCFALCGYTSAILGFGLSLDPSAEMVFQISQARILEILIGLVTAFFVSMLWPTYRENLNIRRQVRDYRNMVRHLYGSLLNPEVTQDALLKEYRGVLAQLMNFRNMAGQIFLSPTANRNESMGYYRYGHRLIASVSGILSLETMKREMLRTAPDLTRQYLLAQREWILSTRSRQQKINEKPAAPSALLASEKGRHFVRRMDGKLLENLSIRLESEQQIDQSDIYIPELRIHYSDQKEALLNALRTFVSILFGMAVWMATQWEQGYLFMVMIGFVCTIGAAFPMIDKLINVALVVTALITIPLIYLIKFGILIGVNSIVPAMIVILPFYFVAALFRSSSVIGFLLCYGFMLISCFLIGFENEMSYDFELFANYSFAIVISFIILSIIFNLIRPSAPQQKLARIKADVIKEFARRTDHVTEQSLKDYEVYLYSATSELRFMPQSREKTRFLAYLFLTLSILRLQYFIGEYEAIPDLPKELQIAISRDDFDLALMMVRARLKEEHPEVVHAAIWELECAIRGLIHFLADEESQKDGEAA